MLYMIYNRCICIVKDIVGVMWHDRGHNIEQMWKKNESVCMGKNEKTQRVHHIDVYRHHSL